MKKGIIILNILYFINIIISTFFFILYFNTGAQNWLFTPDWSEISSYSYKFIFMFILFIVFLISLLGYLVYSTLFFVKKFYGELTEKKYKSWIKILIFVIYIFVPPILFIFIINNVENYFVNLSNSNKNIDKIEETKKTSKIIFAAAMATLIPLQLFTYTIPFIFQNQIKNNVIETNYLELTNTGENVIVIYLDGVSGLTFNKKMSESPQYISGLDGFTSYVKAITLGSKTSTSTPSMIGGFEFSPKYWESSSITQEKFFYNAFDKHIRMLKSNNYHNITFNSMPYYGKKPYDWWSGNIKQFRDDFKKDNIKSLSNADLYPMYFENIPDAYVLKNLSKIVKINDKNENYYNWSFFQNTHTPFTFGDPIKVHKQLNVENYYNVIDWSINNLVNFFEYLKINNAYDNSMIVLFSDHGERFWGDYGPGINTKDLQLSVMMAIKPFNKKGNLIFDTEKLITNADLIQIINKSIGSNFDEVLDKFNQFGYLPNPLIDNTLRRELFFRETFNWKYYPDKIGQNLGSYRSVLNNWLPI